MKPIYVVAVAAAVVGMTGNLWADASSGLATGKRQHKPLQQARKKLPGKLTAHDKSQISGNLNGGTKGNSSYAKNAWPNGKQGKTVQKTGTNNNISQDTWTKGGSPAASQASDGFSKAVVPQGKQ